MKSTTQLNILADIATLVHQSKQKDKLLFGLTGTPEFWESIFQDMLKKYNGLIKNKATYILKLRGHLLSDPNVVDNDVQSQQKITRLNRLEEELSILHAMKVIVQQFKTASINQAITQYETSKSYQDKLAWYKGEHLKLAKTYDVIYDSFLELCEGEQFYVELSMSLLQEKMSLQQEKKELQIQLSELKNSQSL